MIHIRLPRELIRKLDHVAVDHDLDRARVVEKILIVGWGGGPPSLLALGASDGGTVSAPRVLVPVVEE